MLKKVTHVPIFVNDQEEALDFYHNKLGLKIHTDVDYQGMRWLTLHPEGDSEFEIVLMKASTDEQKALVGKQAPKAPLLCFSTDDCKATYEELKNRGVQFIKEPTEEMWGTEALFVDIYGNVFDVVQPKK